MHPLPTIGQPLQDTWPQATCYGCGPANPFGLHIKSYWSEDGSAVVATYHADPKYNAGFDNVMYGGLVASLIDCHSVWAAIAYTYRLEGREHGTPPIVTYVTGRLDVRYLRPTPLNELIHLHAIVEKVEGRKATIVCQLGPAGSVTAEGHVLAVRIEADKSLGAES